jgi:tetratricopeptide (TPR) repeat protein
MELERALQERIWHPLGMAQTTMLAGGDVLEHRATAYRLAPNGESYMRILGEPSAYAGGGIYTSVLDLLKFDQALYGDKLLSEENKRIMFTPVEVSPNYAYGWEINEIGETRVIYHGGGSGGFSSTFRRYPEKRLTLIVLANGTGWADELADRIERMLLGLPYAVATEADLHYKRGMHFQEHESYTQALAMFEQATNGDKPHLPSLYQAARTRILGKFDQRAAIALLDRYISLADESTRPAAAAAWWRKGVAHEQLGEIEQALGCHRKCLELDGGFEMAHEALERLGAGN